MKIEKMSKIVVEILKDPKQLLIKLNYRYPYFLKWMSDEQCIKFWYRIIFGKELDLASPKTFNEKLQWLKLYDRKPIYTTLVDKYAVKEYVASVIGEEYVVPTYGVWDSFDDIDFDSLPEKFVLKCTHDSGGLIICKDKNKLNIKAARRKINRCMKRNFYWVYREWPYKNVQPRIIAEAYLEDRAIKELRDYKFFCFGGVAKCYKVDFDRFINHHANYYDCANNLLSFGEAAYPPDFSRKINIPNNVKKMIELSDQLSKDVPLMRVDFYDVEEKIYFGEMTFFPASGYGEFTDDIWDKKLGTWLQLPNGGGYSLHK